MPQHIQADGLDARDLTELLDASHRYGSDPAYCLAGGGNASLKSGGTLWVTASGAALGRLTRRELVEVDRAGLDVLLDQMLPAGQHEREAAVVRATAAAVRSAAPGLRPSTETLLHHLLPARLVVHTHPSRVNALTCCTQGRALVHEHFGDRILWQPYVDPGISLARALRTLLGSTRADGDQPIVIFLENHGLIVAADDLDDVSQATAALTEQLDALLADVPARVFNGQVIPERGEAMSSCIELLVKACPGRFARADQLPEVMDLVGSTQGRDTALLGPMIPDQIVYCRAMPLWLDAPDERLSMDEVEKKWRNAIAEYDAKFGCEPWVVLIAGVGMVCLRESAAMAEITSAVYRDAARISRLATHLGGGRAMSPHDVAFIERWEAESYRRAVAEQGGGRSVSLMPRV